MDITDSQVHIWEAERPDRPWPSGGFVPPWAFTPFSAEALIEEMDTAGVAHAFLVPPAFDGGRNDYCLDAAARFPGRFAVMGRIPLDDPRAPELMEKWVDEPHGIGLRFSFLMAQQRALLDDETGDWVWAQAQRLNIPLMVYPGPNRLHLIGRVAQKFESLRITIDHMAVGHTDRDRDDEAFRHIDTLTALARFPNVAVKASALPEYSTEPYPYPNLHKYVRQTVDAFGPERVFWGTDLSRLPCTYTQAITMFTEEMTWLTAPELELIMGTAVRKWHGWAAGYSRS
jgi:predicted TIM-barrel fold metal-dependent hydrolase